MKNIMFFLVSLAFCFSIYAQGYGQENQNVYQICENMISSRKKIACVKIANNRSFDNSAVSLCSNLIGTTKKINCLEQIANKRYNPEALQVCTEVIGSSSKIECLNSIANKKINSYSLKTCKGLIGSRKKIECMGSLSGSIQEESNLQLIDEALNALRYRNISRAKRVLKRMREIEERKNR